MNLLILGITVGLVAIALANPSNFDQNYIESLRAVNLVRDAYFNAVMDSDEELPNRELVERKTVFGGPQRWTRSPRPCGKKGCRPFPPKPQCDPGPCRPEPYPFPYPFPSADPNAFQRKSASGSYDEPRRLSLAESSERVSSLFDKIGSAAASLI